MLFIQRQLIDEAYFEYRRLPWKDFALFRKDFKNKYSPFFYRRENKDHSEMLLNDLYIFMTFRSYRFKYALINLYACQRFPLFNLADLQSSSPSDYIKMYVSLGK